MKELIKIRNQIEALKNKYCDVSHNQIIDIILNLIDEEVKGYED